MSALPSTDTRTTPLQPGDEGSFDVSVILVNYNTADLLDPCLERLAAALAPLRSQVFIVDNASRDDSVRVLRERFGHYQIVENARNVGFGRANNQVLPFVRGRYVLLLNLDAYVEPDALVKTIAYMDAHPRCGVLGARLVTEAGDLQPSCRYFPTPWNQFLARTGLSRWIRGVQLVDDMAWDHATERACDWVPGCYYLVRKSVIDSVGLFDPRFFLYCEEVDHCRAVKAAGWEVVYFPGTTVVHIGGESAKSESELSGGRQIAALQIESEILYVRKHHGALGAVGALVLIAIADLWSALRQLVRRRSWRAVSAPLRETGIAIRAFIRTAGGRRAVR